MDIKLPGFYNKHMHFNQHVGLVKLWWIMKRMKEGEEIKVIKEYK